MHSGLYGMGKDVYDDIPCSRESFQDCIPDHFRRNRRVDVKDNLSVRRVTDGDGCLCGSSRGDLLRHRCSAKGIDAKGTAADGKDPESQSANGECSHGESADSQQKPHGQSS